MICGLFAASLIYIYASVKVKLSGASAQLLSKLACTCATLTAAQRLLSIRSVALMIH